MLSVSGDSNVSPQEQQHQQGTPQRQGQSGLSRLRRLFSGLLSTGLFERKPPQSNPVCRSMSLTMQTLSGPPEHVAHMGYTL